MIKTLTAHPYANCKVIINDDLIQLRSYSTIVAEIRGGWLTIFGLYSATTRKHIGDFVREYTHLNYQLAKRLYCDGYRYNIRTGELVEV